MPDLKGLHVNFFGSARSSGGLVAATHLPKFILYFHGAEACSDKGVHNS